MDSDIKLLEQQNLAELYQFADFGRLSAGLFHDLATPLNIVLLNLEELQEQCGGINDARIVEMQGAINRAFNGTQRMICFLQLARDQIQRKTILSEFSLNHEIRQVISLFDEASYSNSIKISVSKNKEINYFGNSTQFFKVIMNLLSNAHDSYPIDSYRKKVLVSISEGDLEILITVQDWGRGMSDEDQTQIFEPLFSTKTESNGSGIGLFISREIIEKHFRGSISFVSSLGHGTTFAIHLPRRVSQNVSE